MGISMIDLHIEDKCFVCPCPRQEMNKLESCPFCGGTKIWIGTIAECEMQDKNHPDYEFNSQHYVVVCDYSEGGCGASTGGSARTVEDAIKAWNRRDGRAVSKGEEKWK